ncbi:hypothetical protein N7453_005073 [Penicillium expansum]|nr:hypothetical protein N7453_005073 [Penicillium expansum]
MHLSALLLLSASLASAQFGPSPEELEYLKNINGGQDNDQTQNQNQGQNYNPNGNINYGNYDDEYDNYQDTIPSPHTPIEAPASSPTPLTHSTFVVRPSQAAVAPSQAQAPAPGYAYNYPSPAASKPFATPVHEAPAPQVPESAPQEQSWDSSRYHAPPQGEDVSAGASGGIAPIDPLRPDSNVAPPPLFTSPKHGKDEGNTFCVGKCFADESDAKCAKPYSLAVYKPAKGCYMCCFTSDF